MINNSQLAVANQDLSTFSTLPGPALIHEKPSSPNVALLSGHLLPDVKWSTLTTFGSDHTPLVITISIHASPSPWKVRSYTNIRKADWDGFMAESERRFTKIRLPTSCSTPLLRPIRTCHSAIGQGHLAASSPGSTRPVENYPGFLRLRYKSRALLVSSEQDG